MQTVQTLPDYEIERGKPMPSTNHAVVQAYLTAAFLRHDEEYSILPELSLELDGTPFVPDISVYRRLRLHLHHDEVKKTAPPLMVVEILSPTQSLDELIRKTDAYMAAGVRSCWVVQPVLETIAVLEPEQRPKVFSRGDVTDPATGITVTIEEIFRRFHDVVSS